MKIQKTVKDAQAFRDQALEALKDVPDIPTLEVLRILCDTDQERKVIDLVLLQEKREAKAVYESYDRLSDLWDKAALPFAAAFPVFLTVLVSEHLLPDPARSTLTVGSYLIGAAAWALCRWAALRYGRKAKAGMAKLGKVD